ncbi:GlpM family protein [Acinetobacter boissieri]|nr:GlpM family protein [Acinetobacter boissieri]
MVGLFLKCMLGAVMVLVLSMLSKSKSFYIAGLIPLFPTFTLIAQLIVFQEQGAQALQKTALFGLWSLIPYTVYLWLIYMLSTRVSLLACLGFATCAWIVAAGVLLYGWSLFYR